MHLRQATPGLARSQWRDRWGKARSRLGAHSLFRAPTVVGKRNTGRPLPGSRTLPGPWNRQLWATSASTKTRKMRLGLTFSARRGAWRRRPIGNDLADENTHDRWV